MGPVVDRSQEHLGTSDVAIIPMRRRQLEERAALPGWRAADRPRFGDPVYPLGERAARDPDRRTVAERRCLWRRVRRAALRRF
ncbi:hypothetical protein [Vulcanimicrobium alpinum]|uniref:hypothetical protein n=1 Tax=Vulcanimicrobium alpinum TaxID=3016050 RepID=UPI003866BF87